MRISYEQCMKQGCRPLRRTRYLSHGNQLIDLAPGQTGCFVTGSVIQEQVSSVDRGWHVDKVSSGIRCEWGFGDTRNGGERHLSYSSQMKVMSQTWPVPVGVVTPIPLATPAGMRIPPLKIHTAAPPMAAAQRARAYSPAVIVGAPV